MASEVLKELDLGSGDITFKRYLLEEFVEDYEEGKMTRREALKKIASVLGSFAIASTILAACAPAPTPAPTAAPPTAAPTAIAVPPTATRVPPTNTAVPPTATTAATLAPGVTISPNDPDIDAKAIEIPGQGVTLLAYLSRPKKDGTYPAILVCHENRGLTEHIKDVTRRYAKAGYVALAMDLLSRDGGTEKAADRVAGLLGNANPDQFVTDFKSGLTYLSNQAYVAKGKYGMTGFCFGGGVTWRCATQIPELKAAVPYYGPNPPIADIPKTQAAVLAMYGANDTRINAGIPEVEAAMKAANKTFEKIIYPNASHAFNNDTGGSYNADAAKDAYAKALAWFEKYVKA
ncbi:MAG: dienelactone hydrolase family protein [Chloroflexi bacterium]|nr:dienelactone hydrolase family protein [Chloroflexota bacterium]